MAKLKYNANTFPLLAEGWARKGLSDVQIAKNLRITKDTFYRYIKIYKDFSDALKRGKSPVDIEVENALLKRARGFEYEEKHTEVEVNKDGTVNTTKVKTVKKLIPPDTGAIAFWLKNRNPEEWRDKHELTSIIKKEFENMSDEELEKMMK